MNHATFAVAVVSYSRVRVVNTYPLSPYGVREAYRFLKARSGIPLATAERAMFMVDLSVSDGEWRRIFVDYEASASYENLLKHLTSVWTLVQNSYVGHYSSCSVLDEGKLRKIRLCPVPCYRHPTDDSLCPIVSTVTDVTVLFSSVFPLHENDGVLGLCYL